MEPTNYADYEYDEFGMVINIKERNEMAIMEGLAKVFDKPDQIVTHFGHPQDFSIQPHVKRRRPRWHNSKKRKR